MHPFLLEINRHIDHLSHHKVLMRSHKVGLWLLLHAFPAHKALVVDGFEDLILLSLVHFVQGRRDRGVGEVGTLIFEEFLEVEFGVLDGHLELVLLLLLLLIKHLLVIRLCDTGTTSRVTRPGRNSCSSCGCVLTRHHSLA